MSDTGPADLGNPQCSWVCEIRGALRADGTSSAQESELAATFSPVVHGNQKLRFPRGLPPAECGSFPETHLADSESPMIIATHLKGLGHMLGIGPGNVKLRGLQLQRPVSVKETRSGWRRSSRDKGLTAQGLTQAE